MNTTRRNFLEIGFQGEKITVLGTAHVSKSSIEEVEQLLTQTRFDSIVVELCPNRHKALQNADGLAKIDLFQVRKNRVARTLLIFLFSSLGSAAGAYIAGFRIFEKITFG